MNIPTVPADKALHYLWGGLAAISGMAGAATLAMLGLGVPVPIGGAIVCAAAALGREAWNARNAGRWSNADIAWTLAGGAVPTVAFALGST